MLFRTVWWSSYGQILPWPTNDLCVFLFFGMHNSYKNTPCITKEVKTQRRRSKYWLETHFKCSITESGPKSQCSDAISFKDPVCKIWRHRMVRKCIATSVNVISCLPSFDDDRVESPKLLSWYTFWTTADKWLHINVVFSQAKLPFI